MKKKVCFITSSPPEYLGGLSIFHKNLLNYLKNKNFHITWAYFGNKNRTYHKDKINYIEIKKSKFQIKGVENKKGITRFLNENYFDVVFCTGGLWTWFYFKPPSQKLIHVFHGTVYYFNKNHLKRFGLFKKILFYPILFLSKLSEQPHYDRDEIICVSNKVKKQVKNLYNEYEIKVIRTGVDLNEFKLRKIKTKNLYGLYIGGGGEYTKGLDRAIELSKEIYKLNTDYRLIIIGPDETKVRHLIDEEFIIFLEDVLRDDMKYYYNICDFFLCLSRYEGGAPTLTTSEAMASGKMIVCSKDSKQEIIKNDVNGLIINSFGKASAKKILNNLKNKKLIKNSLNTIKELSIEKWAEKFLKIIQK